ncbi:hypothetical protein [Paraclostridium sp. AKS73]|nr:hypothetical protein [Paraclostridium sp. AKS73]
MDSDVIINPDTVTKCIE